MLANSYWAKDALSVSLQSSEWLNTPKSEVPVHPSGQTPIILTGLAALWYHRTIWGKNTWLSLQSFDCFIFPRSFWKRLGNFRPCHTFLPHVSQENVKSEIKAVLLKDLFFPCSSSEWKHVYSLSIWLVEKLWRKPLLLKIFVPCCNIFLSSEKFLNTNMKTTETSDFCSLLFCDVTWFVLLIPDV